MVYHWADGAATNKVAIAPNRYFSISLFIVFKRLPKSWLFDAQVLISLFSFLFFGGGVEFSPPSAFSGAWDPLEYLSVLIQLYH
jgi:hypothetical protein